MYICNVFSHTESACGLLQADKGGRDKSSHQVNIYILISMYLLLILVASLAAIFSLCYAWYAGYDGLTDLYYTGEIFLALLIVCCVLHFVPKLKEYRRVFRISVIVCPLIFYAICTIRPNYRQEPYQTRLDLAIESGNISYSISYNAHFEDFEISKWKTDEETERGNCLMSITGKIEKHDDCIVFILDRKSKDFLKEKGEYEMVKSFELKQVYAKNDSIFGLNVFR